MITVGRMGIPREAVHETAGSGIGGMDVCGF